MNNSKEIKEIFGDFDKTFKDIVNASVKNKFKDLTEFFNEWVNLKEYLERPVYKIAVFGRPR